MPGKLVIFLLWLGAAQVVAALPEGCSQVVLVVTEKWESSAGELRLLEKAASRWKKVKHFPVTVGHKGLGIGRGLHPAGLPGPAKQEGDQRAPAGIFRLEGAFGTGKVGLPSFPYRQTDPQDLWVDERDAPLYNQWVRRDDPRFQPGWSVEILHRPDGLYDLAIIVAHNREPILRGAGSAIFMHRWYEPGRSTIGCTAMDPGNLRALAKWLDASKQPVLVQAPRALLDQLDLPAGIREAAP